MANEQYILFDLGNVIVDWNPEYLYHRRIPDPQRRTYFLNHVCTMRWHLAHDKGVCFADNAAKLIAQHPEFEADIRAWYDEWPDMFNGYVEGMEKLITQLKEISGIRLFGLSNLSAEVWGFMQETFPALILLEDVLVSGNVGIIKPDLRIYDLAWGMMRRPAKGDVLFIDDRAENVAAAKEFGFRAHLFDTASQLRMVLAQQCGLILPTQAMIKTPVPSGGNEG